MQSRRVRERVGLHRRWSLAPMAAQRPQVVGGSCTSVRTAGCLTQVDSSPAGVRPRRAITPERIYKKIGYGGPRLDRTGDLTSGADRLTMLNPDVVPVRLGTLRDGQSSAMITSRSAGTFTLSGEAPRVTGSKGRYVRSCCWPLPSKATHVSSDSIPWFTRTHARLPVRAFRCVLCLRFG